MVQIEDIYHFISRADPMLLGDLKPNADLHDDLGITGESFNLIMSKFGREFNVDMRNYLWYFHHPEENALGLAGLFRNSPSFRVPHIPVTPNLLLQAVELGRWPVEYPEHDISGNNFEITIDRFIALSLFLFIISWLMSQTI